MKENNLLFKAMHLLVHHGNLVTVTVMCLVHAVLLLIMAVSNVRPLMYFNILSVVVYAFCIVLCKLGHVMPVFISIILEVAAYTIFSTYYIGLRCGTYCFLFSIVPITIYLGCFLFRGRQRLIVVILLMLNFLLFSVLYIMFSNRPPVYTLDPVYMIILVLFSSFVMVFSTIFYNTLYIYSSEVERNSLEDENRQLSVDAKEDSLTKLLNRRGFLPIMADLMKDEARRNFCVAFCDIDNFKRINDSYGHDAGDEVLLHITRIIRKEMSGCSICRWGGEEIIILMKDYDMDVAERKLEYVRKLIETSPTVFYNKHISTTLTIGLEANREGYTDPEELIKVADERMYYGKQHGKNILIREDVV